MPAPAYFAPACHLSVTALRAGAVGATREPVRGG